MKIMFKTEKGYTPQDMGDIEIVEWFKGHTEKDGTVTEDVMMFGDASVKSIDGDRVRFVFSDGTLDSDLERIDPKGWKLTQYRKNPVVLWGHEWWRPAIGRASGVKANEEKLLGSVTFDESGSDPFASMIASKVKAGIITKGSVGFQPLKIEIVEDAKDPTRLIHREQTLLEFSIVNIPANINAGVEEPKSRADEVIAEDKPKHYTDIIFSEEFRDETSPDDESETSSLDGLFTKNIIDTLKEMFI